MTDALARKPTDETIANVLIKGDLSGLTEAQRLKHYLNVCESLGLNPLTSPFDYLKLSGKTVLYAKRDATEQLRKIHGVSIIEIHTQEFKDVYTVIAKASDKTGRTDVSTGVVPLGTLKGENLANALMKAETKAKRRVTLSICGLGILDESELETVKGAQPVGYVVEAPAVESKPEYVQQLEASLAAADVGVPPSSPLAVGAGQTGETITVVASAPGPTEPLRIVRVSAGRGVGMAHVVFSTGEELPVYQPKLVALAEAICQEGVPVVIETRTSAAGRVRLEKLERMGSTAPVDAPAPQEAF